MNTGELILKSGSDGQLELANLNMIGERARLAGRLGGRKSRVELTARDFEVLRFILEMKFSSSREVFEKFFRLRLSKEEAQSDSFTKKRLWKLEQAGFLKSTYSFSESTKIFVATYRAHRALSEFAPELDLGNPHLSFDLRTFRHDQLVLQWRLKLEREQGVDLWISDRMLKAGLNGNFGFSAKHIPDGIYRLPNGELVAFELEIAQKARAKYQEKIRNYVALMRGKKGGRDACARVHYVCFKKQPCEILKSETKIFGSLFHVETSSFADFGIDGVP